MSASADHMCSSQIVGRLLLAVLSLLEIIASMSNTGRPVGASRQQYQSPY